MKKLFAFLLAVLIALLSAAASGEESAAVSAGDTVAFGQYPQTAEGTDRTPIEWIVLDVQDGKALLISKYGLDVQPYSTENTAVTWETCTLRAWLNGDFLNAAFTPGEQEAILVSETDNSRDQGYGEWNADSGSNTQDRVFLLSYAEANKFFRVTADNKENIGARIRPTAYAVSRNAYTDEKLKTEEGAEAGWWWIRSLSSPSFAGFVRSAGSLDSISTGSKSGCVRPVIRVSAEAAFGNTSRPQPETTSPPDTGAFTFRDSILWGMNQSDVTAVEGNPTRDLDSSGSVFLYYEPVRVGKISSAILAFCFRKDSDRLVAAWYVVENAARDTFDYFDAAYSLKYGEAKEANPEDFVTLYNSIHGQKTSVSDYSADSFRRWEGPGGTQIWMTMGLSNRQLMMTYFSPELNLPAVPAEPEPDDIDLNGI